MDEYTTLKSKYPDKVPLIIESKLLTKKKFLVPSSYTFGELIYFLRKHIKVHHEVGLFLFINNKLPSVSKVISEYDNGDIIHAKLETENVFG